jgi:hypothetical protein
MPRGNLAQKRGKLNENRAAFSLAASAVARGLNLD